MIDVSSLSKKFGSHEVLSNIDFKAHHETVGILGANGSGKTTFLKCLLGLLHFEGKIKVVGIDVSQDPVESHRHMGYIPQSLPLWGAVSVGELMDFFAKLRGVSRDRARHLLEEFSLSEHRAKAASALSGGMRQKLSISIALLSDPEVLILDEPTASLDSFATEDILNVLLQWRGKKTVLISSHRIEEVGRVSDRLVSLEGGRFCDFIRVQDKPPPFL